MRWWQSSTARRYGAIERVQRVALTFCHHQLRQLGKTLRWPTDDERRLIASTVVVTLAAHMDMDMDMEMFYAHRFTERAVTGRTL